MPLRIFISEGELQIKVISSFILRTLEIRPDYHCDLKMCLLNSFAGAKFVDLVKHSPKMWCIVWFENCQTEFGSMGRGGGGEAGGGESFMQKLQKILELLKESSAWKERVWKGVVQCHIHHHNSFTSERVMDGRKM